VRVGEQNRYAKYLSITIFPRSISLQGQLDQLGATVRDLMVPGMRSNFMTADAHTAWLICLFCAWYRQFAHRGSAAEATQAFKQAQQEAEA
jgi:hypothetical protein